MSSRSLSDLKEIGCKSAWPVHISPFFLVNRMTIDLQNRQNLSSPSRIFASILQVRQAPREALINSLFVIPAKAGIQKNQHPGHRLSPVRRINQRFPGGILTNAILARLAIVKI